MLSVTESLHPPYGYTGVDRTAGVMLGWLAGTCVTVDGERDAERWVSLLRGHAPGVVTRPRYTGRYYAAGLVSDGGTWGVFYDGRGGSEGTVLVQVRQGLFELLDEPRALALGREVAGSVRLSRLDLCWDDRDSRVRPWDLWQLIDGGRVRPVARQREITLHGDGHGILRLGSRTSERHLRVYDKWDGAGRRVRHELELKSWAASAAGELLGASARLSDLYDSEMKRMYRVVRAPV